MRTPMHSPTFVRRALAVLSAVTLVSAAFATPAAAAVERWVLGRERVLAHDTDQITIRTRGHAIWVTGDHTTDLDCRLYQTGVLLDPDTDNTDVCLLYTNDSGGPYTLTVENLGSVYNDYVIEAER
jgi:hypothetical protein